MALQQPWLRFGHALSSRLLRSAASWSSHDPSSFLLPRSRRPRPHPRHQISVSVRASLHGSFASTSIETSRSVKMSPYNGLSLSHSLAHRNHTCCHRHSDDSFFERFVQCVFMFFSIFIFPAV
jgi:hypothetical protein